MDRSVMTRRSRRNGASKRLPGGAYPTRVGGLTLGATADRPWPGAPAPPGAHPGGGATVAPFSGVADGDAAVVREGGDRALAVPVGVDEGGHRAVVAVGVDPVGDVGLLGHDDLDAAVVGRGGHRPGRLGEGQFDPA